MMRRPAVLLAISCLAMSAFGCGGDGASDDGGTEGPIVIGTANSLTGALAPFEVAINNGMDLAADDINAAGGVDGRRSRSSMLTPSRTSTSRRRPCSR